VTRHCPKLFLSFRIPYLDASLVGADGNCAPLEDRGHVSTASETDSLDDLTLFVQSIPVTVSPSSGDLPSEAERSASLVT
jgi:hypothetical protein